MRSQIVLLSLLVGIATVVQPTALAESADACTQVGDKDCELAEDAIAGNAEAMADLESFDRVKEILDREALAATPANDRLCSSSPLKTRCGLANTSTAGIVQAGPIAVRVSYACPVRAAESAAGVPVQVCVFGTISRPLQGLPRASFCFRSVQKASTLFFLIICAGMCKTPFSGRTDLSPRASPARILMDS